MIILSSGSPSHMGENMSVATSASSKLDRGTASSSGREVSAASSRRRRGGSGEPPERDQFGYTKADRRRASDDARIMGLKGRAVSPEARQLVDTVADAFHLPVRPTSRPKLIAALEATVADLLVASRAGQWTRRSLMAQSFTKEAVTRRMFEKVRQGLDQAMLMEVIPGHYERDALIPSGRQTLFRPTQALIDLAASLGVTLDTLPDHFSIARPSSPASQNLLVLRAAKSPKVDGRRSAAPEMGIASGGREALRLMAELEELNAHLASVSIDGFAFSGLRRIFNNGDQPDFAWQWGGRFYSVPGGDDYMRWKGGKAARAAAIQLQGEKVGEVDLSASHLTVLYGLLGERFDHTADPYDVPGHSRTKVKRWLTYALGTGTTQPREGRWYAKVREAILERHPVLQRLHDHKVSTLDLQFHEAEVIAWAMRDLRELDGVATLPVFDSLVVPLSKLNLARERLQAAFTRYFAEMRPEGPLIVPRVH